jgi:hypothetical protein
MPKAPVDEHCYSCSCEEDVCATAHTWQDGLIDPISEASSIELAAKSELRGGAGLLLARHPTADLCR